MTPRLITLRGSTFIVLSRKHLLVIGTSSPSMLFRISNRIVTKMGFEVKILASTRNAMLGTYSKDISTLHYLL